MVNYLSHVPMEKKEMRVFRSEFRFDMKDQWHDVWWFCLCLHSWLVRRDMWLLSRSDDLVVVAFMRGLSTIMGIRNMRINSNFLTRWFQTRNEQDNLYWLQWLGKKRLHYLFALLIVQGYLSTHLPTVRRYLTRWGNINKWEQLRLIEFLTSNTDETQQVVFGSSYLGDGFTS